MEEEAYRGSVIHIQDQGFVKRKNLEGEIYGGHIEEKVYGTRKLREL
jgi:hypothetical protein